MSIALRRVLGVWLIIAAACVLYWPTTLSYSLAWTDFDNKGNTHGYVIAAMCLGLIYLRRAELARLEPQARPSIYVALALASLAWLIGLRAGLQTAHQLLFPLIVWLAIDAICGRRVARSCLFAVAYLYFALPFWGLINGALQSLTILATHVILGLIGIPVRFEGNLVEIPDGIFAIEGGCSGLHFMVVSLAIAAYYGELHRDTLRNRLKLLVLAASCALLTNWIRVSIIITAGHLTHMQSYLVRVSHYGFGWAVFAVAMAVFFILASRLPASRASQRSSWDTAPRNTAAARAGWACMAGCAALTAGPLLSWIAMRGDATAVAMLPPPASVPGWTGPLPDTGGWRPVFKGADREELAAYRRGGADIEWYTADYAFQRQGRKLLSFDNSIGGAGGFTVVQQEVETDASQPFVGLRLRDPDGAQSLLWYLYKIGPRTTSSGLRAQLWYGLASLLGPVDSQIVAFRAKCDADCASARQQLRGFVASICDATSRFDNCRRDRVERSDKL
jgi:EpsI family protein